MILISKLLKPGTYTLFFDMYGISAVEISSLPDYQSMDFVLIEDSGYFKGTSMEDVKFVKSDLSLQSCCGGRGMSIWSGTKGQWECSDCGSLQSNDPSYLTPRKGAEIPQWAAKSEKLCTCGATKTYGPDATHADYCDKSKK